MIYKNRIVGQEIIVFAEKLLYSKDAIFKCLYWYGNRFRVIVNSIDNDTYQISLILNKDLHGDINSLDLYMQKLERDLIDFNLRDIVTKETRNVRDLLIAKAFSNGEFQEYPPGDVGDVIGLDLNISLED